MKASGDFFPRLRGLFFALSILALFVISGGLVIADGTAVLEGLRLDRGDDGQSLTILLNGRVDYELNPLDINPLRNVLETHINFEKLKSQSRLKLFIAATSVATGKSRIFRKSLWGI